MAIFIPEWSKLSGRDVQVKRTLGTLDGAHVIRRPLRPGCAADIFIQHRAKGWVVVALSSEAFADLRDDQLFGESRRAQFEQRLEQLQHVASRPVSAAPGLAVLVVMWMCSTQEARILGRQYLSRFGTRLVSREQFTQLGAKLVHGLLEPLSAQDEEHLLGSWFPEAEIPVVCTPRRFSTRGTGARLGRWFLDLDQEWAAKLDLEVPHEQRETASDFSVRLLNGVAGSGKTLIAINRALLLAELFPRQRILVLIHNTPIVADLKERLQQVRGGLPTNVQLLTVFQWLHRQWRHAFGTSPKMPEDPRTMDELVQHHRMRWPDLKASTAQLVAEVDFINSALIPDGRAYLSASRVGRRFALNAAERSQVWALYEAVTGSLQRQGLISWSMLPRTISFSTGRHHLLERHDHILVDEAQFFAPSWFQVVRLSLAAQGQLFLCADPTQGFLKHRLSWKRAGLEVAGRTKTLRRSYRTTRAILETATAVLTALGKGNEEDCLDPDYTGMAPGERPLLVHVRSPQDAIDRLCNELAGAREQAVPLGAFLVIYGEQVNKRALYAGLLKRFGSDKVWWFNERDQKRAPPRGHGRDYLRLVNLDTATGLEGCTVFLLGVEDLFFTGSVAGLGEEEQAERREEHARKLYMAMTRAGQRLVILSTQRLLQEVQALFEASPDPGSSP